MQIIAEDKKVSAVEKPAGKGRPKVDRETKKRVSSNMISLKMQNPLAWDIRKRANYFT